MKLVPSLTNMNVFKRIAASSNIPSLSARQILASVLALSLLLPVLPQTVSAAQDQDQQAPTQSSQAPPYTQQTPEQMQQLVAPIALYPDSLVAQVLAASTFPAEIVEADRWVQANPDLKGDALAQAVDQQPWDPSVKALCAFPTVLGNMDKNFLDIVSGRRLLQPATRCDGRDSSDAPESRASRQFERHAAANRTDARLGHRHSACCT